jgi:DNA anti-recombination protein RmuC
MTLDLRTIIEIASVAVVAGGLIYRVHDLSGHVRELEKRLDSAQQDLHEYIARLNAEGGPFVGRGELDEWRHATDRDIARLGADLQRVHDVLDRARRNSARPADRQS